MTSFEDRFYLENPSRWQALRRDLRLFAWLVVRAWQWLGPGARVRRAYQRARDRGEPLVLEDVLDP